MKSVSVIIPCYNCEKHIKKCLKKLINQTYKNIEIIIIDDGSTDNTKQVCKSYKDERIKYYYKENAGVSSARNYGIKKAKSDYVFFIDSDDYIDETCIEKLIKEAKKGELSRIEIIEEIKEKKAKNKKNILIYSSNEYKTKILKNKIPSFSNSYLYERKIIIDNNIFFDENIKYLEDLPFVLKIIKFYKNIKIIEGIGHYHYVKNPNSLVNKKNNLKNNIENINKSIKEVDNQIKKENDYEKLHKLLINKKSKLIEVEISKSFKIKKYFEIINENMVINELKKEKIKIFYRIFFNYIIKRKYRLSLYISIRNILKKIKEAI